MKSKIFLLAAILSLLPMAAGAVAYNATNSDANKVEKAQTKSVATPESSVISIDAVGVESGKVIVSDPATAPDAGVSASATGAAGNVTVSAQMPYAKCGVNTFVVSDDCGFGAYKTVFYACYDGFSEKQGGDTSCKPSATWQEYADQACAGHCGKGYMPQTQTVPTTAISGGGSSASDVSAEKPLIAPAPSAVSSLIAPPDNSNGISVCAQLTHWQDKISYYEKLANLTEEELNNANGFTKQEIQKILIDLKSEKEKISEACAKPAARAVVIKPVVVESGQEIASYYQTQLGQIKAESNNGYEQKVQALQTEADALTANFIKSRQEIEASELKTVTQAIKVGYGTITAGNVVVSTVVKRILVNTDAGALAIQPQEKQVIINDKNLAVVAPEVTIKDDRISVGDVEVNLPASAVAEKLNIAPGAVELKVENNHAVYNLKIQERRKLLGLFPITINKTMVASSADGSLLSEKKPWYSFLTSAVK